MITDMTELDPVLGQYDGGIIFIGPLLGLSKTSSYRYFYIAGNGRKVYESIGLGFVEDVLDGRRQHADFVGRLKSRFTEVKEFETHLEMARAVHARWPNEETARLQAAAELEAQSGSTKIANPSENLIAGMAGVESSGGSGMLTVDRSKQFSGIAAPEPFDPVKDLGVSLLLSGAATHNQSLQVANFPPLPVAGPPGPSRAYPIARDRAGEQERDCGLVKDDIALAVLRLAPSPQSPKAHLRFKSIALRSFAIFCAMAVVTLAIVIPTTRQTADGSASLSRGPVGDAASQSDAAMRRLIRDQTAAVANAPFSQSGGAPADLRSSPSTSIPDNAQSGASPLATGAQSLAVQHGEENGNLDADQIAKLLGYSMELVRNGDLTSARRVLERATAALPPPVSVPQHDNGPAEISVLLGASKDLAQTNELEAPANGPSKLPPAPSSQSSSPVGAPNPIAALAKEGSQIAEPASPSSPPSQSANATATQIVASAAPDIPAKSDPDRLLTPLPTQSLARGDAQPPVAKAGSQSNQPAEVKERNSTPPAASQSADSPAGTIGEAKSPSAADKVVHPDAEQLAWLTNRAMEFLKNGDLASARLILRRAAEAGDATAALMLGTTYDPRAIERMGVSGVSPDLAEARRWYEKAAQLGSSVASQELVDLARIRQQGR